MSMNVDEVKARAEKSLRDHKNIPDEARKIFLGEIFDWSDNYTENLSETPTTREAIAAFSSIVDLWIQYAKFEESLRQWKKAVEIYENATVDPIVAKSLKIYVTYADYCVARGKMSNAQKVFIKALCAGLSTPENQVLWHKFLELMHKINDSSGLTLAALYEAVKQQLPAANTLAPISVGVTHELAATKDTEGMEGSVAENHFTSAAESKDNDAEPMELKSDIPEGLADGGVVVATEAVGAAPAAPADDSRETASVGNRAVIKSEAAVPATSSGCIDDLDSVAGLTPEEIVLLYAHRPPMLFSAPSREPMSLGVRPLRQLSPDDTATVEAYFHCDLQQLVSMCLSGSTSDRNCNGTLSAAPSTPIEILDHTLDLLEALWYAQALKERHFDAWMSDLRQLHSNEDKEMRLTSGGEERKLFENRCAVQRELLNAVINKTLTAMRLEQQEVLAAAGLPFFSKDVVASMQRDLADRLSRIRRGGAKSPAVVQEVLKLSAFSAQTVYSQIKAQRALVCALLSTRLSVSPVQKRSVAAKPSLGVVMPVASGNDSPTALSVLAPAVSALTSASDDALDYYSQESKQRRKKRRRLVDGMGDEFNGSFDYSPDGKGNYGSMSPVSPGGVYGPVGAVLPVTASSSVRGCNAGIAASDVIIPEEQNALLLQIATMVEQRQQQQHM